MLMRGPVGPRCLFRVGDCATYRPEKIFEGPRFRRISRSIAEIDNQTAIAWSRRFTNTAFVLPACYACVVID
jgi:hypothetical protein